MRIVVPIFLFPLASKNKLKAFFFVKKKCPPPPQPPPPPPPPPPPGGGGTRGGIASCNDVHFLMYSFFRVLMPRWVTALLLWDLLCSPGRIAWEGDTYGWFHPGRRMTSKKCPHFFLRQNSNLNKYKYWRVTANLKYQLRVSRGPHNTILGHALVELVKNTWWTLPTNRDAFTFVGQVHQVF